MRLLSKVVLSTIFFIPSVHFGQAGEVETILQNSGTQITTEGLRTLDEQLNLDHSPEGLKRQKKFDRFLFQLASASFNADGTLDKEAYGEAVRAFVESDLFCSDDEVSNWSSIGPADVGQNNGWVSAVYVDPDNEDRMIIGGRKNGLFKTEDHGNTWTSVTDELHYPVLAIRQLIANPFNPDHLMAPIGHFQGLNAIHENMLHSYDRGETWEVGANETIDGEPLGLINKLSFHPAVSGRVIGQTKKHFIISEDAGLTWQKLNGPDDQLPFHYYYEHVLTRNSRLFVAAANEYGEGIQFWKGELNPGLTVTWSNLEDEVFEKCTPVTSFETDDISAMFYIDPAGTGDPAILDYLDPTLIPFERWYFIQTAGWVEAASVATGKNVLSCTYSDEDFTEAITIEKSISRDFLIDPETRLYSHFRLPKGLNFKISVMNFNETDSDSPVDYIPDPPFLFDYNYLFANTIYESGFYTTDQDIRLADLFDIDESLLFDPALPEVYNKTLIHLRLEKNADYEGNPFEIEYLHLGGPQDIGTPKFIDFSNWTDDSFLMLIHNTAGESRLLRTTDNGNYFEPGAAHIDPGGPEKNELILSPNRMDEFYHAAIHNCERIVFHSTDDIGVNVINGEGHHLDYRASHIESRGGDDYILFGNDGGVAEIPNALSLDPPTIHSLNGDLRINMIHTFDVHDKTGNLLLGLQDNSYFYYNNATGTIEYIGTGDGSAAYIHPDDPDNYIHGDPQKAGNLALMESAGFEVMSDMEGLIDLGECFLGMQIVPYRSSPDEFIVSLEKIDAAGSPVLINNADLTTTKKYIPDCDRVCGIGISETDKDLLFVTDGKEYTESTGGKFFKSTDGGDSWDELGSRNIVLSDGTVSLASRLNYNFLTDVVIDPRTDNVIYASVAGIGKNTAGEVTNGYFRVIKSINQGEDWVDCSEGLPALPVKKIMALPSDIGLLFAGTDAGVYYKTDDMDQWECFSNALPLTTITDLEYNYCTKELYASTYGRGIYKTPVNLNVNLSEDVTEISSDATWAVDKEFQNNVVIKSGVTLVVQSTVSMYPDTKIIVEPGAHLIVDGAYLTSSCSQFWHGIEVWGNNDLPQVGAGAVQGKVTIKQNAIIENAAEAISNWKSGDWTSAGGIVKAYNSSFINCKRSAAFLTYTHTSMDTYGYQALFDDCTFEWNDDFLANKPQPHVTMLEVDGIHFSGCDFLDNRTDVPEENAGTGIRSIGANYAVLGAYIAAGSSPEDEYYDETGYDISRFTGLLKGIEALSTSDDLETVKVDHVSFVNCKNGVYLSGVDQAVITRNKFSQRSGVPSWALGSVHLYTFSSAGYTIEGNIFDGGSNCIGSFTENSGGADNVIYKNKYSYLMIASYAKGQNTNGSTSRHSGLRYECNEYGRNDFADIYVYASAATHGIRSNQGSLSEPAGNLFNTVPDFHINVSPLISNMNYYYDASSPVYNPVNRTANVTTYGIGVSNACRSGYAGLTIGVEDEGDRRRMPESIPDFSAQPENVLPRTILTDRMDYLLSRTHFSEEELNTFARFADELALLVGYDSTYNTQNELIHSFLVEISHTKGISAAEAQNLLCFYWGECGKSTYVLHDDLPLAENKNDAQLNVMFYPNPASETVNVLLTYDVDPDQPMTLEIVDPKGKLILEKTLTVRNTVIALSNIATGVYFVRVTTNEGTVKTDKLIVR